MSDREANKKVRSFLRQIQDALLSGERKNLDQVLKFHDEEELKMLLNSVHKGSSCLHAAILLDNPGFCTALLDAGADVNLRTEEEVTPVYEACGRGNKRLVKLLLERGADPNIPNAQGVTPLHQACTWNSTDSAEICRILLKSGADIDFTDRQGYSALHRAVSTYNNDVVFELCRNNCDVNQITHSRLTALMLVCSCGSTDSSDIVESLLLAGCDMERVDVENTTALMMAVKVNDIKLVKLLLQNGADPSICTTKKVSPLLYASQKQFMDIVDLLLKSDIGKSTINYADFEGNTPLSASLKLACQYLQLAENCSAGELAARLIYLDCDLETTLKQMHWTPLFLTVAMNNLYFSEMLLTKGANVEHTDKVGNSLLHVALSKSRIPGVETKPEIISLLLQYGCDINSLNLDRETPLYKSISRPDTHMEVIDLLLNYENCLVDVPKKVSLLTPLHAAATFGHNDVADKLVQKGCNINHMDFNGVTYLSKCIIAHNTRGVDLALNHPDIDVNLGGPSLPLHLAVSQADESLLTRFIDKGANINKTDSNGDRPIQIAIKMNQRRIIRYLLKAGCILDPTETDKDLMRKKRCCYEHHDPHPHAELQPLFAALKYDDMKLFEELLQHYHRKPYKELKVLHDLITVHQNTSNRMKQIICSELRQPMLDLLRDELSNPWSLVRLSRGEILQTIGLHPREKIERLEIPERLKGYLLYEPERQHDLRDINED